MLLNKDLRLLSSKRRVSPRKDKKHHRINSKNRSRLRLDQPEEEDIKPEVKEEARLSIKPSQDTSQRPSQKSISSKMNPNKTRLLTTNTNPKITKKKITITIRRIATKLIIQCKPTSRMMSRKNQRSKLTSSQRSTQIKKIPMISLERLLMLEKTS